MTEPLGRFGYVIHSKKIPPMGNIACVAKVTLMATEAGDKMQETVEHWIAAKGCET
jgi:hypothetical protein